MDSQRILLIILILMTLGVGYYYYQVYHVVPATSKQNSAVADLDARLNEIRPLASVELDISIFENAFFRSLKIITATTGERVLPGRTNPFLPF